MSDNLDRVAQLELRRKKLEIEKSLTVEKWLKSDNPNLIVKAQQYLEDVDRRQSSGIKTLIFDPNGHHQGDGYKRKGRSLNLGTLRSMSKVPLISSIIKTRVEQVSDFTTPQTTKFEPGFIVRKKKRSYFSKEKDGKVTREEQKRIDDMVEYILNCGESTNQWHGDTFDSFTRKVIPDSLALDQGCFEVVRNRKGIPIEHLSTDAATMRLADSIDDDEYRENGAKREKINGYYPSYVQVIDGTVRNEYYPWELCFGIRNPTTNIYNNGYGNSELEDMMKIITWMLNSDEYNGNFFSQGSAPKGILKISGNVNNTRLQEFRQSWQATTATVANAHKIPVIESENMDWIDLQGKNRDMEFSSWQEYLIKVACAMYKIDPSEVFELTTSKGGLNSDKTDEKIQYSKDKGLKPLLKSYQAWLNKYIVNPRDSDLEIVFVGLDPETEEKELELDLKRAGSFMGYKEIRAKYDLGDLDDDDVILSSEYLAFLAQKQGLGEQGGVESNQFMDEEYGKGDDDMNKSEDTSPFVDDLNDFIRKNLLKETIIA